MEAAQAEPRRHTSFWRPLQAIVARGGLQALTMAAGLTRTKVLAVVLGPEGFGITGVIDQAVTLVAHLGSLSLPFAALTVLSRSRSDGAESFSRLHAAFFSSLLGTSVAASGVAVAVVLLDSSLIGDELEPYRWVLVVALLAGPVTVIGTYLRNVLAAVERHHQAGMFALLGGVGLVGSSYVGLRAGGLAGLYWGNLVIGVLTAALMLRYLRRSHTLVRVERRESAIRVLAAQPGLGTFLSTIHLLSLFSPAAYLIARVAVLEHQGAQDAGLFYAAYGIATAMRVVLGQSNALYLAPLLNQPTSKEARAAVASDYLRALAALLLTGSLAIVLFPQQWLRLLYSTEFVAASALVAPFVVSETVLLVASVYQMLLIGYGDVRAHALIALGGQVVLAVGALLLTPTFGSLGVAAAFIAGHGLTLALLMARVRWRHGIRMATRGIRLLPAAGGLLLLVGWWAAQVTPSLAMRIPVFALLGVGALGFLTPDERRGLLSAWRRRSPSSGESVGQ